MRVRLLPGLLLASGLCIVAACGPAPSADVPSTPTAVVTTTPPDPTADATASASATDSGPPASLPPKGECDAFMDIVARTTALRASIQREPSTAAKAAEWATRAETLAAQSKKLPLTHPDLVIENAGLATRMSDLSRDLRALETAENARGLASINAAHKRVLDTSEQVEVLTREPAARCAGDTKALQATSGRLPAAKIQAIVRERFASLRTCYEEGLKRNPNLEGRVSVRFVIALDGRVESAHDATTDPVPRDAVAPPTQVTLAPIGDPKVVACVLSAVKKLQFPKPDGGTVSVVYPFIFSPTP